MLDYLIGLVGRLGHWGYLVIFLGATLESAAFLGLLIPGESLVLVAGFFAAQRSLDLDVVIIVVAVGAALGDSIGYEMGRKLGRPALMHYGSRFGLSQARIDKAEAFFAKHGGKAVFLGRFIGFARALVPFLAGSSRMRYGQFLPFNILGAALWSSVVTLLGYFLGASWQSAEHWIGKASAILAGVVIFILALVWLWRIIVSHEVVIKQRWSRFLRQPRMQSLLQRFAPHLAFIEARLSPQGVLGLHLTLGATVLIGAGWLFGGIAEDVVTGDPLTIVDVQIAQWLHAHGTPALTQCMLIVTHLHDPLVVSLMVALMMSYLIWKKRWYGTLTVALVVPGGMLLNVLMKHAFHRARPSFENPLVMLTSYSFPSGHVAGSTLFYGVLAALVVSQTTSWSRRVWIVLLAFAMVALVAFSRMYLGAHYLSDVLAALAEGIAWLALCLTGMHTYRVYREAKKR
jgi:undecaprenyl-diphosphatase